MFYGCVDVLSMPVINSTYHFLNSVISIHDVVDHREHLLPPIILIFKDTAHHPLPYNSVLGFFFEQPCIQRGNNRVLKARYRIHRFQRIVNGIHNSGFILIKMLTEHRVDIVFSGYPGIVAPDVIEQRFQLINQSYGIIPGRLKCLIDVIRIVLCIGQSRMGRIYIAVIFPDLFRGKIIEQIHHSHGVIRDCNVLFKTFCFKLRLDPARIL